MSETIMTIDDAARCLPELVERVHTRGEPAVLTKAGEPVARIVPVLPCDRQSIGLIAFLRQWRVDHPEPDEQFGQVIAESRKAVRPPHDPWE